jgi:hypothetical protein
MPWFQLEPNTIIDADGGITIVSTLLLLYILRKLNWL